MTQARTIPWLMAHRNYRGEGCLIWPFGRTNGYGFFGRTVAGEKLMFYAHRWMCEQVNGPPPSPSHEAAHECGNGTGGCVHPLHVVWKTKSQNQLDRAKHGTKNGGPVGKLNEKAVAQIRALKGKVTQKELAARFGCSRSNISFVQLGKLWPKVRKRRRAKPAVPYRGKYSSPQSSA
jgi:hypothetical protein